MQAQFKQAGIPLHELGLNRLAKLPAWLPRLFCLVWKIKPQVIHGWMHHGNLFAVLAWWFAGCRPVLLWGMHHTPEAATLERAQHAWVLRVGRWLSGFPQRIIYVSKRSRERHREMGYADQRAQVLANGIPLGNNNRRVESYANVRQELGLAADALLVGSLTRLVPEKDLPNLFAAIGLLQASGQMAHFLLAGEGMSAHNPAINTLLETVPDKPKVHLLGVRTDAARLIAALDIATLSSRREAFPLFLAEAMAAGVPCVATDVGDIAECVADTGLVVPPNDSVALAQAWADILQTTTAQRQALGEKAQARVAARYSLDAVVDAYRALLSGVA
jgi:glycosyltransferase involved in cell wall biosynthesis